MEKTALQNDLASASKTITDVIAAIFELYPEVSAVTISDNCLRNQDNVVIKRKYEVTATVK